MQTFCNYFYKKIKRLIVFFGVRPDNRFRPDKADQSTGMNQIELTNFGYGPDRNNVSFFTSRSQQIVN